MAILIRAMRIAVAIGLLTLALSGTSANAASFDCGRARTADEIAICDNRELNDLDVRMTTMFDIAKSFVLMGQRGAMQDEQHEWLAQRRLCGANVDCLRRSYRRRIAELEAAIREIRARGPF